MLVVDTSALVAALSGDDVTPALLDRLSADGDLRAPHLLDIELLQVLRRASLAGRLSETSAAAIRSDVDDLGIVRYPHRPFADRIWDLRHNLSAYDAAFVALAEALDAPLLTCDARLAGAPGHTARIELY